MCTAGFGRRRMGRRCRGTGFHFGEGDLGVAGILSGTMKKERLEEGGEEEREREEEDEEDEIRSMTRGRRDGCDMAVW